MPVWLQITLHWLGVTVYVSAMGVGVVSCFLGAPGTLLILLAAFIFSAAHSWAQPSIWLVLGLIPVAVVIELVDNFFSMAGVRKFGGSSATMWWALVGAIVGGLVLGLLSPLLSLIGALLGGFLAGYWYEVKQGRDPEEARRAGWGALLGRLAGGGAKSLLALVMVIVLLVQSF